MTELARTETSEILIKDRLDLIGSLGKALQNVVNDILDFALIIKGNLTLELTEVNLTSLLQEVIDILNFQAKNKGLKINIISKLKDQHTSIKTDASRLRQILFNLQGNAIKFTPTGAYYD